MRAPGNFEIIPKIKIINFASIPDIKNSGYFKKPSNPDKEKTAPSPVKSITGAEHQSIHKFEIGESTENSSKYIIIIGTVAANVQNDM